MKRKSLCAAMMLISILAHGQQLQKIPKANWYNLDLQTDGMFGISMDKAYTEVLKGKSPSPVIVAVIDGGLDIGHEDLKDVIWVNPNEIPGNGKDDDNNGYIDDVNGWNFLGSSKESFEHDNEEIIYDIRKYKALFGDKDSTKIASKDLPEYRKYKAKQEELNEKINNLNIEIKSTIEFLSDVNTVLKKMGKDDPTREDFKNFIPTSASEAKAQSFMALTLKTNPDTKAFLEATKTQLKDKQNDIAYHYNIDYDPRAKNAKEYSLKKGWFYGNTNIYGPVPPAHGTHVAGIIGAERNNKIGINGVADAVKLMSVRAVPDGGLLARDEASAIRYAADNGAKVINMSFDSCMTQDRKLVEDAVNYALSKDILFIQAAGNTHDDLDLKASFPNRQNGTDKNVVDVFIRVGASGFIDDDHLAVSFSNFGKQNVDVFAPGQDVNSTVPGNLYEAHSGTSMAAPVVAGLAAVIREYYPKLTAKQVKEIIMKSVIKREALKNICVSGGIINAYEALKLAANY